ncbi:hypothetical protein FB451DRAFT_1088903 [Mycena latifolia]|nr:hypothetical protein FB451DRAFT_1088903 [Mycena latifolia]
MALRKVADDEWTASGVKSVFTIEMPGMPTSAVSVGPTAICGWGWRFSCAIEADSSSTSPILMAADSSVIPWRRVTVFFHPDFIRGADYGRIRFLTDVENLLPLNNALFYTEWDLPDHSGMTPSLGEYMHRSDAPGTARIGISVVFPPELGMALPRRLDARVEEALSDTIRGDEIVDLKFYAYTRRVRGEYVTCPRAMYAKMALLRGHSDDLDEYLKGISGGAGFTESVRVDLDLDVFVEERFTEYGYMSDSDLDSEEDEDGVQEMPGSSASAIQLPDSPTGPLLVSRPITPSPDLNTPLPELTLRTPPVTVAHRMGHAVVVKGHAYKTWNALLYYLYTNRVTFRTLDSPERAVSRVPECSAKSMYKLADRFGLSQLKNLALESLTSQLSPDNIVGEAFSTFTSVYPEIQDIEVEFLIQHLPNLTEEIEKMLKSLCDDVRPHCFDVLRKVVCRPSRVG